MLRAVLLFSLATTARGFAPARAGRRCRLAMAAADAQVEDEATAFANVVARLAVSGHHATCEAVGRFLSSIPASPER